MIQIIATAESVNQAKSLLESGVDVLYIGDDTFALRVPEALSRAEILETTRLAHEAGKKIRVAVNAIMHPDQMMIIRPYLDFLQEIQVDELAVGDAGVVYVLDRDKYQLPYVYDASTMVASSRQVNFWADQGAVGAVLARELPKPELEEMADNLKIPGEVLVYGATVIHHSKRPLLQNYFNFIRTDAKKDRETNHFLAEPKDEETHYSIFEDSHGTHIFANDDIDMMTELGDLATMGYDHWKLDGIFTRGVTFIEVVKLFVQARDLISAGKWSYEQSFGLDQLVRAIHPLNRTVSQGFYKIDPDRIN